MLIVGGIVVVVLAALAGVIWLSMGEARAEKAPKDATTSQPQVSPGVPEEAPPSLDVTTQPTLHLEEQTPALPTMEENASEVQVPFERPDQQVPALPAMEAQVAETDGSAIPMAQVQKEITLNDVSGQLYEVTDALLMLGDRVGELDVRLNNLATVLEEREKPGLKALAENTNHQMHVPNLNHEVYP